MAPANTAGVQGCLQITNAMPFKIPPHRPTSILARARPTIFAVAIWSLLLASGYLKIAGLGAADSRFGAEGMIYELAPANFEIVLILKKMVSTWFERCSSSYHDFIKSLLPALQHTVYRLSAKLQLLQYLPAIFLHSQHPRP